MNKKVSLIFLFLTIIFLKSNIAQVFDWSKNVPVDSSILIGKLNNGFTYYIKKNSKPEKRVELRLAVNAGSVLEDTDQLGLAHFTEHMAFNGTKHFAKNELVNYLQSIGIKFGAEVNAYTGFDATVYMLLIPTDKDELIKQGLQVLYDWANEISFDSLEIEKERGVIIEEWRLGRGAEQRMEDKYLPVLYYNSRYASRLPIGTKESLDGFRQSALKRFYHDWYRPDQMAIVAVGDIDVNKFEKSIKDFFSKISATKINSRPRINFSVPNHKETLVCIATDKEAPMSTVGIFYTTDEKPQVTLGNFREYAKRQLYFEMFNQRISELTRTPNPPFINAYSSFGNIGARGKDAYISEAIVDDTGILKGLRALLEENEKAKRFGFTQSELDRSKTELLNTFEKYYNEKDKTESETLAAEYIRNFLTKETIPGIAFEYTFMKKYLPEVTLEDMNTLAKKWIIDTNIVIIVTAPQKDGLILPDEKDIRSVLVQTSNKELEAYSDNLVSAELIQQKPVSGKIISEKSISEIGISELKLSNGINIILKPTDFKNDEILLSSISPGGQSLYPDSDNFSASFATSVVSESGVSDFSLTTLQKMLAGKTVDVEPYINMYTEGIKGNCAPKDLETMFQLIYLYFTQPRIDTSAYISFTSRLKAYLKDIYSDPQKYYSDQLARILSQNHPRGGGIPKVSDIDKINLNRVYKIYRDRFADAGDFTFVIVGNFKADSIKPLLETYLGSLPSINRKETWKDLNIRPPKGNVTKNIYCGSDPKSIVTLIFTDSAKYSEDDDYLLTSLSDVLDIRLIEVLREEKSGVYNISATASMNRIPYNNYNIKIKFPCAPYNTDSLINEALYIANDIKINGVSKKNMEKIKKTQERELEVDIKTNSFWLKYLENAGFYNDDLLSITKKRKTIKKLKSKDLQSIAKKYIKEQYVKVILYPKAMEKK